MEDKHLPEIDGNLRKHMVRVPQVIDQASGIRIFGKLIKSLVFTTDVAIIRNCNANAHYIPCDYQLFRCSGVLRCGRRNHHRPTGS